MVFINSNDRLHQILSSSVFRILKIRTGAIREFKRKEIFRNINQQITKVFNKINLSSQSTN